MGVGRCALEGVVAMSPHSAFSQELAAAYAGKRVLVTGHTGFKGSWLGLWLHSLGAVVHGCSLEPPSTPSLFEAIGLGGIINDHRVDIRDFDALSRLMEEVRPEVVFHLAAQPLVRRSYAAPRETFETNVMGTVNVLDAARALESVQAVVNVTSDKCYENKEWPWGYRENDPMGGHDPYSASKGCAELVAGSYLRAFYAPRRTPRLASVRAGNVVGGGDWGEDRIVPDCMRALSQGLPVRIRNPRATRPWQHVLEPLSGYLLLGARLAANASLCGGWNFGPRDTMPCTVGSLVESLCGLWGSGSFEFDSAPQAHEANMLKLDCSKAMAVLGWTAVLSVDETLALTVAWYKAFYRGVPQAALRDLTLEQINAYTRQRG